MSISAFHDEPAAPAQHLSSLNFVGLLKSEWTKLVSLRSAIWSLSLLVVVTVGFTALFTWFTVAYWDRVDPLAQMQIVADPTRQILGAGFQLGQLAVCVLGVLVMTSEYASGTIRASLLGCSCADTGPGRQVRTVHGCGLRGRRARGLSGVLCRIGGDGVACVGVVG